jgi:methyltransferase (TIGR00027 family)
MEEHRASRTALGASLMRAIHTRWDRPALIDDPWGERLVSQAEKDALLDVILQSLPPASREQLATLGSRDAMLHAALRTMASYGWVVVRMRYAEDALAAAVGRGVRQYVILGAGLDSFGLRQPAFAREIGVFEIDHPSTQEFKRQRLRECGVMIPDSLHFIAADLSQEQLGTALARSPFRPDRPTFFSWLGVTPYLTREANLATLRAIAKCTAARSELVFTYLDEREFDAERRSGTLEQDRAIMASLGEPWVSGFDPGQLPDDLRGVGLRLVEDLDGEELRRRYCSDRTDGLSLQGRIARAMSAVA